MGLRCLLGHDYGDTRTEREEEQRGDEIVVTETEIEECTRCGDTRVVSENTEVRSLAHTESAEPSTDGPQTGEPGPPDPTDAAPPEDVEVVIDDAESDTGGFDGPAASTGNQSVETDRPTTDDAEIIDGDDPEPSEPGVEPERALDQWPESDVTHPEEAGGADHAPTSTEPGETADDSEIVDADGRKTADDSEIVDADAYATSDDSEEAAEIVDADAHATSDDSEEAAEIVDADAHTTGDDSEETAEIVDADAHETDESGGVTEGDEERLDGEEPVVDDAEIVEGPGGEDAEIVDETHSAESPAAREARSDVVEGVTDEPPTPTDDAEIVDGDGGAWPSHDTDDEGYDAQPDDAASDVSVDGMQPSVDPESLLDDEDTEFVASEPAATGPTTNGTGPGEEATGVDLSTTHDDSSGEYFCPDCGHAEPVGGSSMRKGDICPECMRGYIDERATE